MSSPLALSPAAQVTVSHFGREAQPLVRVEHALADPDLVIDIAARHTFARHGDFYPGIRAPVSEVIAMPLVFPLLKRVQDIFGLARPPRYSECYLSLLTVAPGDLTPIQRLPHFDGVEAERIAVLLYLDREGRGGTAFYRQRATGYESVDASRFERYRSELEKSVDTHGLPDAKYIVGDTAIFARSHIVPDTFNSMVIYRGNALHCAAPTPEFTHDPDPRTGRLTLNLFLS